MDIKAHATVKLAYHGLELRCPSAEIIEELIELAKETQRRDEERGIAGGETHISWVAGASTERDIEDLEKEIKQLSDKKLEHEADAGRFDEQRAEINAKIKEILEDD